MKLLGLTIGRVNIPKGEFTYGNRIALGEIFSNTRWSEYKMMKEAYKELYGYSCLLLPLKKRCKELTSIVEDFSIWIEREKSALDYQPTADQVAAGIEQLAKKVGSMSTLYALAERFGVDPDEVLKWEYAKVFGILFVDLERYKYQERERRVIDAKYKRNNRFHH